MSGRGFEALVIATSLLGVNALHTLMRRGQATRVTSLIYLTPIFAVAMELAIFDIVPSDRSITGIVVTCVGVALVGWRRLDKSSAQLVD